MAAAIILDTPEQINQFALRSLRLRLKMEKIGMKCRGKSAKSIVSKMFGVSNRTSYDDLMAMLVEKIG